MSSISLSAWVSSIRARFPALPSGCPRFHALPISGWVSSISVCGCPRFPSVGVLDFEPGVLGFRCSISGGCPRFLAVSCNLVGVLDSPAGHPLAGRQPSGCPRLPTPPTWWVSSIPSDFSGCPRFPRCVGVLDSRSRRQPGGCPRFHPISVGVLDFRARFPCVGVLDSIRFSVGVLDFRGGCPRFPLLRAGNLVGVLDSLGGCPRFLT